MTVERGTSPLIKTAEKTNENCLFSPITQLPSEYKPYPKNIRVTQRRYGWLEIKQISARRTVLSNDDHWDAILGGVNIQGMDKEELTVPDGLYIGLVRKLSTLDVPFFEVSYMCSSCNQPVVFQLTPDKLVFSNIKAPELPIVAQFSFGEMKFSPITIRKHRIYENVRANYKDYEQGALFVAMNSVSHSYEEAFELLQTRADVKDIAIIESIDKLLDHGLQPVTNICQTKIRTVVPDSKIDANELYKKLNSKDILPITRLMDEYKFDHSMPEHIDITELNAFLESVGSIAVSTCNHQQSLALDGGQGFVLPFRFTRDDVLNSITFGNSNITATSLPELS